ncbi:hypothetical protein BC835DRAFT_1384449 [Cytidiella melzeri]|nr:hypothetical protein BC835DRAFT_1384449 [Cytidiella melzeri]
MSGQDFDNSAKDVSDLRAGKHAMTPPSDTTNLSPEICQLNGAGLCTVYSLCLAVGETQGLVAYPQGLLHLSPLSTP